ncbi:MAG: efflux RND transporter permease subunit [Kiloniellales bacterium]|nr:efflux RND transporter permease subunit [Kiloniellales bacterium]
MKALIDAALGHSRTVLATLVLVLIAGTYAYVTVPKEADPDINIPIIYVSMSHEGISPEDAERLLIKPMEEQLEGIEGVKERRATAFEGGASVVLEFEAGFDADKALDDVREKVDLGKPELPDETDEPTVNEVNLSLFPVMVVTLSGELQERVLLRIARDLKDELQRIPNVLDVTIGGDREEQVELIVDPLVLESYNLDAEDIISSVSRSNRLVAAGAVDTGQGRFSIKVPGLFETVDDILNMPIKVDDDVAVTFGDIGVLKPTFKDPEGFARINGKPALALEVRKRTGANIIETIESVRAAVAEQQAGWPENLVVTYSQDKSTHIRTMLTDLQNNVASAILLVMIVVVAALGLRSAGLVGVAIPGSFLTGILVLATLGFTINIVVLFSLILAVGMLVDGAIVVTEYADRKMCEGLDKRSAYGLAAKRMAWPIIAATATTLAAFLPLIFWPGIVGEFMKFLPITLVATLTASLLMALIFVPTLGAIFGKSGGSADPETAKAISAGQAINLDRVHGMTGTYLRVLNVLLKRPGTVLLAAVVLLIGAQFAYVKLGKGIEFFPDVEPDNAALQVHARGNLSVQERDALLRQVEERVLDLQRERGEFHAIYARSVASSGRERDDPEDIIGTIRVEFVDWDLRRPADIIMADVRQRASDLAGIFIETRKQEAGPPVGKPIQIEIASDIPELIAPVTVKVYDKLRSMEGLVDLEDGLPMPGIEWQIEVDRAEAAKYGADVSLLGSYVRMVTNGMKLGEYRPDESDDEIDIVVRLPEVYRTVDYLDQIRVQTKTGLVPISNFVTRSAKPRVGLLRRVDGSRSMTLRADTGFDAATGDKILADDKVNELKTWLATTEIDPRVKVRFKGEDQEQKEAQAFLMKAFIIALFLMAIILVTQFNSFYSAFLILSAVVMSTIGVMLGLLVTGQPFGIVMSGIGVIALAGIVVNNNIVLIDTFDRLKESAPSGPEAILQTGAQRLRPVLLTTVTTILGLMPMVLGMNIDFIDRAVQVGAPSTQWWRQLSTAIVFGLGFATLLTLFVTPSALMLRENLRDWRDRRRRRAAAKADAPDTAVPQLPKAAE